jgi:hypothetical protein
MPEPDCRSRSALCFLTALCLLVPMVVTGQTGPPAAAVRSAAPVASVAEVRTTPWGDPDLQGLWNHGTITPLQRPADQADRVYLTEEEVAVLNEESETRADRREGLTPEQDVALAYNAFWWDRGVSVGRTSLLVDPSDGRLPPLVPAAAERAESAKALRIRAVRRGIVPADGPEEMDLGDRCLVYRPVPITSSGYNNHVQIAQAPGYVTILQEQIHELRVIPLDDRPPLPPHVTQWLGVSRGRWDGDTLVVETTNFREDADYLGSNLERRVTERFRLTDDDQLEYQFTVADPTVWTRPWTGMVPWRRTEGPMFEYACHEGNYGMVGLLKGSRLADLSAPTP